MPRQAGSPGRATLDRLVKHWGRETVVEWLRDGAAAAPSKRRRGRPKGPQYDDTPRVQAAAALWRQAGRPARVWPELLQAGGSLSVARRLLYRLAEWGEEGCAERHVADFYAALCTARNKRAIDNCARLVAAKVGGTTQEARRYLMAFGKVMADLLRNGDSVHLRGFGRFWVGTDGQVKFRAGSELRAAVARSGRSQAAAARLVVLFVRALSH